MNNEQRGVALLIVLMLLALMAALAADMTISFHGQLHRTRQVNHHLQRQYDIELAEKLALASLTQTLKITTDKPRCSSTGHNRNSCSWKMAIQ